MSNLHALYPLPESLTKGALDMRLRSGVDIKQRGYKIGVGGVDLLVV